MQRSDSRHELDFTFGWALILPVLVFLLILCVQRHLVEIPADISSRVQRQLEQAGYSLHTVRVDGRDVFLSGVVTTTDANRMIQIVKSVRGVGKVWMQFQLVWFERSEPAASWTRVAALHAGRGLG